jgi:phospholipid/cholesterol/gamma-HCH transport system substrate-binding protein
VPQANGAAYTTYDQSTGVFQDPAGGTGIFAPGNTSSAENWLDLMRDPRPL